MKILKKKFNSRDSRFQIPDSGFTLIEALVATTVFAFVVSSIIGVYISVLQLDRKTRAQTSVSQNARFIMEFLAKEIRNGSIDYSGLNSCVNGSTKLCLINQAGEAEYMEYLAPNLVFKKASTSTTNLNSAIVKVTKSGIYMQPAGDPFTAAKNFNEQPHVTVVLELTASAGSNPADLVKMNLQTTFAVRVYPAR